MSKLSITEAVKIIPVSESTLRRDLKSGKVSFETDTKNRKRIDIAELSRVYGQLNGAETTKENSESSEPVNDSHQNPSMNGNETPQDPSVNGNDSTQIIALLENQVADLRTQLQKADARETVLIDEKSKLLDLTDRLQKQNETLMLPPAPKKKKPFFSRLFRNGKPLENR
jgi:hypothetical protein